MASFEIDFGPDGGGVIKFADRTEFNSYLEQQIQGWANAFANSDGSYPNALGEIQNYWTHLLNTSVSMPDDSRFHELHSNIQSYLNGKLLVAFNSFEGERLLETLKTTGQIGVHGAWMYRLGNLLGSLDRQRSKGAILYQLMELGLSVKSLELSKKAVEANTKTLNYANLKFTSELETKSQALDLLTQKSISAFDSFFADAIKALADFKQNRMDAEDANKTEFAKLISASKLEFEGLQKTFESHLALEAPVKYWKRKSKLHNIKYNSWKKLPLIVGPAGLILIFFLSFLSLHGISYIVLEFSRFLLNNDPSFKINSTEIMKYTFLIFGSCTLFLASLYIWALRFFIRMMMTEHHLQIDAEARSTMAETYLALSKLGTSSDTERAVVMNALFKPVTDGIVKDDGMPAMSPAALLSNAMQTNRGPG